MILNLAPGEILTVIGMAVLGIGAFYGVKYSARDAKQVSEETQRLVRALHGRFDKMEDRQQEIEIKHARLDEQVKYLHARNPTLRFHLPEPDAPGDAQ